MLNMEENEKENFGMLYISMLAVKLIEMIVAKYEQIQLIGGLVPPKQLPMTMLESLERNDQVTYEYLQSSDFARAGALQLIRDIDYFKKTFKPFCVNSLDEQQQAFFSLQRATLGDQKEMILSKHTFKALNSIQLACAVHPFLVARGLLLRAKESEQGASVVGKRLPQEFREVLESCANHRQVLGQLRQFAAAPKGTKSPLGLDSLEQSPLKKISLTYLGQIGDLKEVL